MSGRLGSISTDVGWFRETSNRDGDSEGSAWSEERVALMSLPLSASTQVKCIEFHPVLPLIALADKDDVVQLWNYESQEVRAPRCRGFAPTKHAGAVLLAGHQCVASV
jgi:hypothetical protein